jgi:rubrerythrin
MNRKNMKVGYKVMMQNVNFLPLNLRNMIRFFTCPICGYEYVEMSEKKCPECNSELRWKM